MMPDGWQDLTLAEVATVAGGGTPSRSERAYWNGDIPWATPTDVTGLSGRMISRTASTITEAGLASSSATLLPPNSLLMTTRATIGACAINRVSMATNQGFQNLVPRRSTSVELLYYLIQHHKRGLERLAAGSTFLEVSKQAIRGFRVTVAPFPEQLKIAAILSSVDDAIEKTQGVIDQVQVVKRGLIRELLVRGLPGRHTRFKQTAIGEIPTEWAVLTIDTLCNVVRGSTPRPARDPRFFNGTHVPWITVSEVTKDDWPFLEGTRTGLTEEGARFSRHLNRGTVILTNSGVTLGIPKLLKIGGCANDGIAAFLDVSGSLAPLFLYYALAALTDTFQRRVARGVGQPNLNTSLIGNMLIPVPSRLEQDEVVDILFGCDHRIAAESNSLKELHVLKSALMSVLLSGELAVVPGP